MNVTKADIFFVLKLLPGVLLPITAFMSLFFVGIPVVITIGLGGPLIIQFDVLFPLELFIRKGIPVELFGDFVILVFFFPVLLILSAIDVIILSLYGRKYDKVYIVAQELVDDKTKEIEKLKEGKNVIPIKKESDPIG